MLTHLRHARSVHGAAPLVVDDALEADEDLRRAHVAVLVLAHPVPTVILRDLQLSRLCQAEGDAVVLRHHLLSPDQLSPARFRHLWMLQGLENAIHDHHDRISVLYVIKRDCSRLP